jgi:4'-phosphopantetheinyl transferase
MRVWQADLRQPDDWIEEVAIPMLGAGEVRRRGEESPKVWRRRVVARAALRMALGRCLSRPPDSLVFVQGPSGKPELAGRSDPRALQFNLAHSGVLCLIAVSRAGPIGVDLEEVRDFPELEELVEARFAPSEAAGILERSGDDRVRSFYRCWTRKEAYLKATGVGLDADLKSVVVSVGDRAEILSATEGWSLIDLDLGDRLSGAVAVRGLRRNAPDALQPEMLSITPQMHKHPFHTKDSA